MTLRSAGLNPNPTLARTSWSSSALYWNAVSDEKPAPSFSEAPASKSEWPVAGVGRIRPERHALVGEVVLLRNDEARAFVARRRVDEAGGQRRP